MLRVQLELTELFSHERPKKSSQLPSFDNAKGQCIPIVIQKNKRDGVVLLRIFHSDTFKVPLTVLLNVSL